MMQGVITRGAAYLVYGRLGPTATIYLDAIASGVGGFKLQGPGPSQEAGSSVAGVGDVNNDGYDDFLVGAGGFRSSGTPHHRMPRPS